MEGLVFILIVLAAVAGGWFYLKKRRASPVSGAGGRREGPHAVSGADVLDRTRGIGGVRAGAFRLVDDNGETRASAVMIDDSPYFSLSDRSGHGRLFITINHEEQATLFLRDENSETRMAALVDANGDEPLIALYGQDGQDRRL